MNDKSESMSESSSPNITLTLEDGTDKRFRNVDKQPPTQTRNILEERRPQLHRGLILKSLTLCCYVNPVISLNKRGPHSHVLAALEADVIGVFGDKLMTK